MGAVTSGDVCRRGGPFRSVLAPADRRDFPKTGHIDHLALESNLCRRLPARSVEQQSLGSRLGKEEYVGKRRLSPKLLERERDESAV